MFLLLESAPQSKIGNRKSRILILLTDSLGVRLAVWIEELLPSLPPRRLEFGRRDVPVRPAFLGHGTQVLAEFLRRGPAEEPVAVVDLVNDKTGLQDGRVRNHRIVDRIGVLGDVEVLLDLPARVGEERPMGTD